MIDSITLWFIRLIPGRYDVFDPETDRAFYGLKLKTACIIMDQENKQYPDRFKLRRSRAKILERDINNVTWRKWFR